MDNAAETLSSLRFGVRARGIVNTLQLNAIKLMHAPSQVGTAKQLEVRNTSSKPLSQAHAAACVHAVSNISGMREQFMAYTHPGHGVSSMQQVSCGQCA